ncbi:hypothetical protein [Paracoccus sanguinis]|uniref:hypothetical protein n=1 Tax=Paracoccus sanguinis TaxID=1545044 RepID=UPI0012E09D50|nr:hypothetical protein [Paracoccus sanguinis]
MNYNPAPLNFFLVSVFLAVIPATSLAYIVTRAKFRGPYLIFAAVPLLAALNIGLSKTFVSPITPASFDHYLGAVVEKIPETLVFLAAGAAGIAFRKDRALGYLIATISLGFLCLLLVAAGRAAEQAYPAVLESLAAYLAAVLFAITWYIRSVRGEAQK